MASLAQILGEQMTPEQIKEMAIKKVIAANKRYIELVTESIKKIKEMKCDDRLSYALALETLVNALAGSIKGWQRWCSLFQMNNIKLEEFEEILPKMMKCVIDWLEIDREITEVKTKELEGKITTTTEDTENGKRGRTRKKGSKPKEQIYVA